MCRAGCSLHQFGEVQAQRTSANLLYLNTLQEYLGGSMRFEGQSATPSLHLWFLGVAEDCCMLSIQATPKNQRCREGVADCFIKDKSQTRSHCFCRAEPNSYFRGPWGLGTENPNISAMCYMLLSHTYPSGMSMLYSAQPTTRNSRQRPGSCLLKEHVCSKLSSRKNHCLLVLKVSCRSFEKEAEAGEKRGLPNFRM